VAFHAGNLLLHAAATLLLARLFRRAGFSTPLAGGAALLFAVHPVHVEAVTSVVGRGETLAAVFVLGYLLLTLREAERPRVSFWSYAAALLCYFLGTLTKESAAVAPALAFLLIFQREEGGPLRRHSGAFRRGLPLYAGSAAVLAGVFAIRSAILGGTLKGRSAGIFELENPLAPMAPLERAMNASAILFRSLGRIVFPALLSSDESAWSFAPLTAGSPLALAAALLLLFLAAAAAVRIQHAPATSLGILFFLAAMLPAGNLVFPIGTVFAERLLYLSSAGICLLLAAWVLGPAPAPDGVSRARLFLFALVALLFSARTVARNTVWESDTALFSNSLRAAPGSAKAHYNLAYTAAENGDSRRALSLYTRATEIYPRYFDAWAGKGRMEKELGRLEQAERSYRQSLAARPAYENGFFGLGVVREARGNWRGAEEAYAAGLKKAPRSLPLAYRLALAHSRLDPAAAEKDWRRALTLGASAAAVRLGYADWLLARGRRAEARREAREALRRSPAYLPALRFLAERSAEEDLRLAEGLAREKIFRITRSREDLQALQRTARKSPAYAERYRSVRPDLRRLAPWAFRALEARPEPRGGSPT